MRYTDAVCRTRPLVYLPLGAASPPGNTHRNLGTLSTPAYDDGGSQPYPSGSLGASMGNASMFPTPGQNADKIGTAHDDSMNVDTFSVMAWVQRLDIGAIQQIATRDATSIFTRFWQFRFDASDRLELSNQSPASAAQSTGTLTDTVRSHQVAVVVASTAVSFYIDGANAGTGTISAVGTTGSCGFTAGNLSSNNATHHTGKIGHVAYWTRALGPSEIAGLYAAGRNGVSVARA